MAPTSPSPTSLSTVIATTKAKIAENPTRAQVVMRAAHDQGATVEVASQVGSGHRFTVDEPVSIGGGNAGPSPIEYALAALGSCQAITYRFWAAHLGMALDSVHVDVEGDIDMRGFFGLDDAVRPGYGAVRVAVRVRGPESPERYEELAAAVDAHCPILDLFTATVEVNRTMTVEIA
jgi:uncharacterized OsmC-like protein